MDEDLNVWLPVSSLDFLDSFELKKILVLYNVESYCKSSHRHGLFSYGQAPLKTPFSKLSPLAPAPGFTVPHRIIFIDM